MKYFFNYSSGIYVRRANFRASLILSTGGFSCVVQLSGHSQINSGDRYDDPYPVDRRGLPLKYQDVPDKCQTGLKQQDQPGKGGPDTVGGTWATFTQTPEKLIMTAPAIRCRIAVFFCRVLRLYASCAMSGFMIFNRCKISYRELPPYLPFSSGWTLMLPVLWPGDPPPWPPWASAFLPCRQAPPRRWTESPPW